MLLKLLPSQVAEMWGEIEFSIRMSLPPMSNGRRLNYAKTLETALIGDLEVWVMYYGEKIVAIATTMLTHEPTSKEKHLLIYSLASITDEIIPDELWVDGYETLKTYAKGNGCKYLNAFSMNPKILELVKKVGGDSRYHYITLEV